MKNKASMKNKVSKKAPVLCLGIIMFMNQYPFGGVILLLYKAQMDHRRALTDDKIGILYATGHVLDRQYSIKYSRDFPVN